MGLINGRITEGFASEYNINSLVHCFIIHCHFYVPFPSFIQMNINILCVTRRPLSLLQVSNRFRLLSGNEGATSGSFSGGGKRSVRGRVPGRAVHLHLHLYPPHCPEPTGRPPREMETVWDCLLLQAVTFFKHNSTNICAQGWGQRSKPSMRVLSLGWMSPSPWLWKKTLFKADTDQGSLL